MGNEDRSFIVDNYRGHELSVRALKYENGWVATVTIIAGMLSPLSWRDRDNCYSSDTEARDAGVKWAKGVIDKKLGPLEG